MAYKIKVRSRILYRNGDYEAIIRKNTVVMTFLNPKVAASTFKVIESKPQMEVKTAYDGKVKIYQSYLDFTEEEIFKISIEQLDSAIRARVPLHKLSYTWEKIK